MDLADIGLNIWPLLFRFIQAAVGGDIETMLQRHNK